MILPYPAFAVGDLHGQRPWLDALLRQLEHLPEWPTASLIFLGDLVDRGPDVKGTVEHVRELCANRPHTVCIAGNHDHALARACGLGGEPAPYWSRRYRACYDHAATFQSYIGRPARNEQWDADLAELSAAIADAGHAEFLGGLPWVAETAGHVFVHNGLSPEFDEPAGVQLELLRRKQWHGYVTPKIGTVSHLLYEPEYPVWLGADRKLADRPLPVPGRVIVNGHERVKYPQANAIRIRIDTTGGSVPPLTACLLRAADAAPEFTFSEPL